MATLICISSQSASYYSYDGSQIVFEKEISKHSNTNTQQTVCLRARARWLTQFINEACLCLINIARNNYSFNFQANIFWAVFPVPSLHSTSQHILAVVDSWRTEESVSCKVLFYSSIVCQIVSAAAVCWCRKGKEYIQSLSSYWSSINQKRK